MSFLLYWTQNPRTAEPRGLQRSADPAPWCWRWRNEAQGREGLAGGSSPDAQPRPVLFPRSPAGNSSGVWRWPMRVSQADRLLMPSWAEENFLITTPTWFRLLIVDSTVMLGGSTYRKRLQKSSESTTREKLPSPKNWLAFTLNVKGWILQTVTYFFKITLEELRDNLASISNLCYLTYFHSYNALCEIFYMDRSMVIGKLQYVQVQMLLGNEAWCKYVVFYIEAMLPAHTGGIDNRWCKQMYLGEDKVCL